jgi:hypothetical protein
LNATDDSRRRRLHAEYDDEDVFEWYKDNYFAINEDYPIIVE